jgi:hypothetical protein
MDICFINLFGLGLGHGHVHEDYKVYMSIYVIIRGR